ncbi:MAG: SusC/RagA family TonB-linked outer membrane protein [Bacteroidota bacterium]
MKQILPYLKWLLLLLLCPAVAMAQFTVTGKVTDKRYNDPIVGAAVLVKSTTTGINTDVNGDFRLEVPGQSATLIISFIGYLSQEVPVTANSGPLALVMTEDVTKLEEVVVTGLASSVKRSNSANAVGTVSAKELTGTTNPQTLDGALYGKLTGANIVANSGAPGGGISMKLRGISTITGSSEPLYIVDGVYMDNAAVSSGINSVTAASRAAGATSTQDNPSNRIADLNPADIENIEVLKGPSAAAIYGARANAGVVLITTKRGKGGKTSISFNQDIGVASALHLLGMREYTDARVLASFNAAEVTKYQAAKSAGKLVDYEKELYGNKGSLVNSRISLSGGTEKTRFFISGALQDEKGIIKNTGFQRKSIRINVDHKISKIFDFAVNANFINSSTDRGLTNNDNAGISYGVALSSTVPWANLFADANGIYPNNPYASSNFLQTRDLSTINEENNRFLGGGSLNVNILQKNSSLLRLQLRGGFDYYNLGSTLYFPESLQWQQSGLTATNGFYSRGSGLSFNTNASAFLIYTTDLSKVALTSQLGMTRLTFRNDRVNSFATQLTPGQANVEQAVATKVFNRTLESKDIGYLFQQEANFEDKIIATAGIRLDQSNMNGDPNRIYAFPKVSLAANLTKFDFWQWEKVNQVKLRIAYGEAGGIPSANPTTLQAPKFSVMLPSNIAGQIGVVIGPYQGEPNIQPERSKELETGIDIGLWENRVSLEASYYIKTVDNLILTANVPLSSGFTYKYVNAGSLQNKGVELGLGLVPVNTPALRWSAKVNFWLNRAKMTRLDIDPFNTGGFSNALGSFRIEEGKSPTQIVGVIPEQAGVVQVGDGMPKFQLSFYNDLTFLKNFQFSMLWHWKEGGENINLTQLLTDLGQTSYDFDQDDNSNGVVNSIERTNSLGSDTRVWVQDASFVKLREVALYYNIPAVLIKVFGRGSLEGIRLGVSGNNLLLFSKYKSYDPEVSNFGNNGVSTGVDVTPYPSSRRVFFHLAVTF